MSAPIEFFFDFSSPYGYFASCVIDAMAQRHGRKVTWKPIMIGSAFKASGNQPLIGQPLKGAYSTHDWDRLARLWQVPYRLPEPFPVAALAPSRLYWWMAESDPRQALAYARSVFHAYFGEGRDISQLAEATALAAACGADPERAAAVVADPAWKQRLRDETDAAIARWVFGSPFLIVDGEPFWGADRLWMVEVWLERGGW